MDYARRRGYDSTDSRVDDSGYSSIVVQPSDATEAKDIYSTALKLSDETVSMTENGVRSLNIQSFSGESLTLGYNPTDTTNVYFMEHPRRGHLVVVNNRYFDPQLKLAERSGTDVDASKIYTTFKKLGFEIDIQTNMKRTDMMRLFISYSRMDHSDCDCFAAVILSHGVDGVVMGTDGAIDIQKLVEPLQACKSLVGKPKLFFIQACQGDKLDEGVDVTDAEVYKEEEKIARLPKEADFLYAYSTAPGYFAFRNSQKGSFYITALAEIFQKQGTELEVTRLLTKVGRKMAIEFESFARDPAFTAKRQMPCFMSMLTKDLYFPRKK